MKAPLRSERAFNMELFGGPISIIGATALMALQDTVVKMFNESLPLWQLFVLRSAIILPVLIFIARRRGVEVSHVFRPWVLLRSLIVVAMYVAFYAALPVLDLAVVAGVYYTAPLWIVLFSAIFLQVSVTRWQILTMLVAFCGVLIVLRPSGEAFTPASLIPLLAAVCYAFVAMITQSKLRDVGVVTMITSLNIVFVAVGVIGIVILNVAQPDPGYPFLLLPWAPLTWTAFGATVLLSVISVGVHALLAHAYQRGPMATVASLDYSYLIFATVWSFFLLGSTPEIPVVLGMSIIGCAGVVMILISKKK